mmetsp:Transcript_96307/g.272281  ORF Transcript_96307/g.272281 Transcript_96307/m.272281 type:complete len:369 (+) Transcript_96307:1021-2127(+)
MDKSLAIEYCERFEGGAVDGACSVFGDRRLLQLAALFNGGPHVRGNTGLVLGRRPLQKRRGQASLVHCGLSVSPPAQAYHALRRSPLRLQNVHERLRNELETIVWPNFIDDRVRLVDGHRDTPEIRQKNIRPRAVTAASVSELLGKPRRRAVRFGLLRVHLFEGHIHAAAISKLTNRPGGKNDILGVACRRLFRQECLRRPRHHQPEAAGVAQNQAVPVQQLGRQRQGPPTVHEHAAVRDAAEQNAAATLIRDNSHKGEHPNARQWHGALACGADGNVHRLRQQVDEPPVEGHVVDHMHKLRRRFLETFCIHAFRPSRVQPQGAQAVVPPLIMPYRHILLVLGHPRVTPFEFLCGNQFGFNARLLVVA